MMVSSRVDQKLALAPSVDTIKWLLVMLNDDMSHGPRTPVKRHNDGLGDDPLNGQPDVDDPDKDTTDKLNELMKGSPDDKVWWSPSKQSFMARSPSDKSKDVGFRVRSSAKKQLSSMLNEMNLQRERALHFVCTGAMLPLEPFPNPGKGRKRKVPSHESDGTG